MLKKVLHDLWCTARMTITPSEKDFYKWRERSTLEVPEETYLGYYLDDKDSRNVSEFRLKLLDYFQEHGEGISPHLLAIGSSTFPSDAPNFNPTFGDIDLLLLSEDLGDVESTNAGEYCNLTRIAKSFLNEYYSTIRWDGEKGNLDWSNVQNTSNHMGFLDYERPNVKFSSGETGYYQAKDSCLHLMVEYWKDNSKNSTFKQKILEDRLHVRPFSILN